MRKCLEVGVKRIVIWFFLGRLLMHTNEVVTDLVRGSEMTNRVWLTAPANSLGLKLIFWGQDRFSLSRLLLWKRKSEFGVEVF